MWDSFNQRHESRDAAFEALCCQLFERWCRREYGDSIRSFYFVDGRGGDGGVEAFAILNDDSIVGMQAKAWWDGFHDSQRNQIDSSLRSATTRHPSLSRYVVCCPLNLLPARGRGNSGTSQQDRWQTFEADAKVAYPGVTLEYRGKTRILEWLQQPDSETIGAYWFDGEVVPRDHWRQQFVRVKSAWMDLRYVPDLHVSTVLDEDLTWFVNSPRAAQDLKVKILRLANSLELKRERISNLENLPGNHSPQALSDCATLVEAIDSSLANLKLLKTAVESQGIPAIDIEFSIEWQIWEAVSRLWKELGGRDRLSFATSPTQSVLEAVKGLEDNLEAVRSLLETQQRLRRIHIVLGEAGTGKTQTITKLCDTASGEGVPVLVLPARAFNPSSSWSEILGRASNRPSWTADQILDALEASSLFAWRESPEPQSAPRRAILALDGPDENLVPGTWNERLKELADLCKSRPLIAPIVTTRPESCSWLSLEDERFEVSHLRAPDVADQLPEIFRDYTREYDITVPSPAGVAWALRTPFAIRVFAEVYQGRTIAPGQDFVTTLAELFRLKLHLLDNELHQRTPSWLADRELSLRIFVSLVPAFLGEGHCMYERFADAVRDCLTPLGITVENAAALLERSAKDHGLIEVYPISTGRMTPDRIVVRPGFNALLDYLLATEVAKKIRRLSEGESVQPAPGEVYPPTLQGRSNVGSLVVAMLLKDGISILGSELWKDSVHQEELEAWHARAISDLRPEQASAHKEWVSRLFRRDMVSCRMLVAELILPSSRIATSTFGAEFFHQEFTRLSMTERDLVWSGPDWLPANCGGPWEGNGSPIHDAITLRDDDSAVSTPILVAWVTSSVIHERQRQAIARLAKWGSRCPAELAELLLNFATVDDVQVVESVVVAAAGAVLELVEHGSADNLAKAARAIFFANRDEKDHPSVVARHAARLVIERAFTIGTELPQSARDDATPPYLPAGAKLPIDSETVALVAGEGRGGGDSPLFSDLDWYVAKEARDPFFEHVWQRSEEGQSRRYAKVSKQILDAVADGSLKVEPAVRAEIEEEIKAKTQTHHFWNFDFHPVAEIAETCEESEVESTSLAEDAEEASDPRSLEEILEDLSFSSESPPASLSHEAEAILADYAHEVSASESLSPKQLGNGLIVALLKKWGWNKETFYGDPRGQAPGEILGADIAIIRQHSMASHGSRSSVAMFVEKYVWSAVNVVSSFLSDRLPGKDDRNAGFEMITDQSNLGSGMPDPLAGDWPDVVPVFRPPWNPAGIAPRPELSVIRQPDRGIQWLELAAWPDPADWFGTGADEQIMLAGFLSTKDHAVGIQIAAWVSCVAVPRTQVHLIKRDVGFDPSLWSSFRVHEIKGHFGGGVYAPLRLAVWAPWVTDGEPETWHTLSDSGEPVAIQMIPLVTESHWRGTDGETSAQSPTKLLRVAGGIVDCRGTDDAMQFVGRDRMEIAYFQRLNFPDEWGKSNEHLEINRSKFFQALGQQDLVPVWGIRVYRELLPELRPKGFIDQNSHWLVTSEDSGASFRSVLTDRVLQDKCKS